MNMLSNNGELQNIWISKGMQAVSGALWGGVQDVRDYFSLRKTNDALALENHDLRVRIAELEAMTEDSLSAARMSLTGQVAGGFRYTPAIITKISNNTRHNYIIIGKGTADGVRKGSGVITGKGAIGVIDAVSEKYSFAGSFKNHGMSISARLSRSGAVGPLMWDGIHSNRAVLKEIPHHMTFSPGDTVYTSGYSSIFPADIPLGVTGGSRVVNGATYEIDVTLFEDYSALRYITIVENLNKEEIKSLEGKR